DPHARSHGSARPDYPRTPERRPPRRQGVHHRRRTQAAEEAGCSGPRPPQTTIWTHERHAPEDAAGSHYGSDGAGTGINTPRIQRNLPKKEKGESHMKGLNLKFALVAGLAAAFTLPAVAGTTTYQIDPRHSSADFGVTHLMISTVRGEFHGVNGTIVVDDGNIGNSTVNVTIDATTVDTREPDRDKHLKSDAFFDVGKYPTITFKSTKVEKNADGSLKITGDLTIRGVTKSVVLNSSAPKPPIQDPSALHRT